jgi:serine/threonine protein kinase
MNELSEADLRAAVHATLHALVKLHGVHLVHRDLRLENILWRPGALPFLADLELAAAQDLKVKPHFGYSAFYCSSSKSLFYHTQVPDGMRFIEWDENTLSSTSKYSCTSDLYQLGRMMTKFSSEDLSAQGLDLCDKLLKKTMKTAKKALTHPWVLCQGHCRERH